MSSFFFYVRLVFAWAFVLFFSLALWSTFSHRGLPGVFLTWLIVMIFVITSAISHLRRVRFVNGSANASALANRQRRQIEMPMEAGPAFDILDATIRELPNVEQVESTRDSLQIRAKVRRVYSYGGYAPLLQSMLGWFGTERNQIFAIVTPHSNTGTVTLVCEPESGAWRDWLTVDNGTNLENAEAISRAISRRITEVRRGEQASTRETEIEKELAIAKLALLHAQVEPHFLYNTLANVISLIDSQPSAAKHMIERLIDYLRRAAVAGDAEATLGTQLALLRAYLDVIVLRMGSRLSYRVDVPETLLTLPLPPMLLQPLVENAIKHGLEPKVEGGDLLVSARREGDRLVLGVRDDGLGVRPTRSADSTGLGLANLRDRLAAIYGARARMTLEDLAPGTLVTLELPATTAS
jgi:hypothetical protein